MKILETKILNIRNKNTKYIKMNTNVNVSLFTMPSQLDLIGL